MFKCLAIDMGAGSIRLILAEITTQLKLTEIHRFNNTLTVVAGHHCWDLENICSELEIGIKKALDLSPDIQSIAVDSWGVDFVMLNKNNKTIGLPISYRDKRTEGMPEKWSSEYMDNFPTFKQTGVNIYPYNSLYQLLSMKDTVDLSCVDSIMFVANYIAWFLSGVKNNELSLSSTSQLLDVEHLSFNHNILRKLNLRPEQFPKAQPCGTIIGELKQKWDKNHTKVCVVPSHDTAAAIESIPYDRDNFAYISTGTWCIIGFKSDHPIVTKKAFNEGITNEITHEKHYKVHKNVMGLWLVQRLKEELAPEIEFSEFEKKVNCSNAVNVIVDPNDSRFFNPDSMVKAFDEIITEQGHPTFTSIEEYAQCAYQSLAVSFGKTFKILEELKGETIDVLHMIGGGIQSTLLCQLTANSVSVPVFAGPIEGAAIGNVIWQAKALKHIHNEDESRNLIQNSFDIKTYYPQKTNNNT